MRRVILSMIIGVILSTWSLHAQSPKPTSLTQAELNGKKMFQQRCSICHTPPSPGTQTFGPLLSGATVDGKEAAMRVIIVKGTPRMPGFEYGLEPKEIDNIIAYLKTVKKTEAPKAQKGPEQMD